MSEVIQDISENAKLVHELKRVYYAMISSTGTIAVGNTADMLRFMLNNSHRIINAMDVFAQQTATWKAYAQHQEHCRECGNSVYDCEWGMALQKAALSYEEA